MDDTHTRTTDALEELARLYLTGREDEADAASPPRDAPAAASDPHAETATRCEALWLGHVPGLANPWVGQYAHRVAQQSDRAVLLIRLDAERLNLERYDPGGASPADRDAFSEPLMDPADLDGTLRRAARSLPTVLLHADANAPPEAIALLQRASIWTLLTGTDQAALVAGYRLLKQQFDALGAGDLPAVRFLLLGTRPAQATTAASKLAATVERFLQVKPEPLGAQQKMMPTAQHTLGRFAYTEHPHWADTLAGLIDDVRAGAFEAAASSALSDLEREMLEDESYRFPDAARAEPTEPDADADVDVDADADAGPVDRHEAAPRSAPSAPASERPAAEPAIAEPASEPGLESESDPRVQPPPASERPALPALVEGLTPVGATCPYADSVALAVDEADRLHLLIDAAEHDSPAGASATLMLVERWAADHRALLNALAGRTLADTSPVAHLFTAEPGAFQPLAALGERGGTMPLHLHLLRREDDRWTHHRIT